MIEYNLTAAELYAREYPEGNWADEVERNTAVAAYYQRLGAAIATHLWSLSPEEAEELAAFWERLSPKQAALAAYNRWVAFINAAAPVDGRTV